MAQTPQKKREYVAYSSGTNISTAWLQGTNFGSKVDVDSVASDVVELIGSDRTASQLALADCIVTALVMTPLAVNINNCDRHKLITMITQRIHSVHMMALMHGVDLACVCEF